MANSVAAQVSTPTFLQWLITCDASGGTTALISNAALQAAAVGAMKTLVSQALTSNAAVQAVFEGIGLTWNASAPAATPFCTLGIYQATGAANPALIVSSSSANLGVITVTCANTAATWYLQMKLQNAL